jgi:hypothetical protein
MGSATATATAAARSTAAAIDRVPNLPGQNT